MSFKTGDKDGDGELETFTRGNDTSDTLEHFEKYVKLAELVFKTAKIKSEKKKG